MIEATGVGRLVVDAIGATARNGIVCLTGVSSGERSVDLDIGGLNRTMVLENDVVFGSVNANRRHYEDAAAALERADRDWLRALISRRVPLERWQEALERRPDDVKVVVALDSSRSGLWHTRGHERRPARRRAAGPLLPDRRRCAARRVPRRAPRPLRVRPSA